MSDTKVPETRGVIKLIFTPWGQKQALEKTIEGYDLIHFYEDYFSIPVNTEIDGHTYYIGNRISLDLNVDQQYELTRTEKPIWAHLEYDTNEKGKYAGGTFILTRNGRYPKGKFYFYEEDVFKVKGEFDFEPFAN